MKMGGDQNNSLDPCQMSNVGNMMMWLQQRHGKTGLGADGGDDYASTFPLRAEI
jgi:hypothetical protein